MAKTGYELRVNVGRWQSVHDYMVVDNIDDATLQRVAKRIWALYDDPGDRSTQVLIWDASDSIHNLIAVWTRDNDRLVVV